MATILIIRAVEKSGVWTMEHTYEGGDKSKFEVTSDQAAQYRRDLEESGWRVNASLYNGGWAARAGGSWGDGGGAPIPFQGEPLEASLGALWGPTSRAATKDEQYGLEAVA
jgi:hypothetical protein